MASNEHEAFQIRRISERTTSTSPVLVHEPSQTRSEGWLALCEVDKTVVTLITDRLCDGKQLGSREAEANEAPALRQEKHHERRKRLAEVVLRRRRQSLCDRAQLSTSHRATNAQTARV